MVLNRVVYYLPFFLYIYIDELLLRLKASGYGCYAGDMFFGALGYGDDITLLAPSPSSLKLILHIVKTFGKEYNVTINPSKSQFLVCGKNNTQDIKVKFNNTEVNAVPNAKHLGNYIGPQVGNKMIEYTQNDFVMRVNFILSNFGNCNHVVKYKLMKMYCMALYGAVLWDVSDKKFSAFCSLWRRCVRKLINVSARTHSNLLYLIVEDINIECQIHKRMIRFIESILTSQNPLLSRCGRLIKEGSRSNVSTNLFYIVARYNCSIQTDAKQLCNIISLFKSVDSYNHRELMIAENIKTILYYRDSSIISGVNSILNYEELEIMLDYFCTCS